MKVCGVIPARYHSSRFRGKPLALINGVPMIKRTYDQAKISKALDFLVVATESELVFDYCKSEGMEVIMTSDNCLTGTDRVGEVAELFDYNLYVNIQGDEPVIDPKSIDEIVSLYKKYGDNYIAYNLYKYMDEKDEPNSPNSIKVVVNQKDELMYMSRYSIPFNKSTESLRFKKQVCVYGFTKEALKVFGEFSKTINEKYEDIEILRFLDLGYKVKMVETNCSCIAVDVPGDIKVVESFLNSQTNILD